MGRQGNKYERTVAFVVIPFKDSTTGEKIETDRIYLQQEFILPISQKVCKSSLRNVERYIEELTQQDKTISSIRLDRISHIKVYECKK